jgi:hypothetical protein
VLGVEAHADAAKIFRQGLVVEAELMELAQDASRVWAGFARRASCIDEAKDCDTAVGQLSEIQGFALGTTSAPPAEGFTTGKV